MGKRTHEEIADPTLDALDTDGHGTKISRSSAEPQDEDEKGQTTALICRLPPTCSGPNRPTYFSDAVEMERHYAMCHTHICAAERCHTVFPDARFLELHQVECHDPLTAIRKDNGERTFECFVATCKRIFLTPKARRLHLISVHDYPKEFFFAITNKGVGGLLEKWGPGASLIRGKWKPREKTQQPNESEDDESEDHSADLTLRRLSQSPTFVRETAPHLESPVPSSKQPRQTTTPSDPSFPRLPTSPLRATQCSDESMNVVTQNLASLSLVPSSVRFGRGGKQRSFPSRPNPNRKPNASSTSIADASTGIEDPKAVR